MRVLYVEDNPANVFLVKRVARAGNHDIINMIDGAQALKKFDDINPDLVLMDIQLTGDIGGLEVVRQLRARGKTTPIIAVTAYAMVGDKERCLEAGCDEYMAKPLPIPKLVELFERYDKQMAQEQQVSTADTATAPPPAESSQADSDAAQTSPSQQQNQPDATPTRPASNPDDDLAEMAQPQPTPADSEHSDMDETDDAAARLASPAANGSAPTTTADSAGDVEQEAS